MRYFIALEIPEDCRRQILEVQNRLKSLIPEVKLTDNNKLHLTLAFIGEQSDEMKKNLTDILRKAAEGIKAFEVTPAYLDGFPTLDHAHTFWVGVKGEIDKLYVIRERIKDGLNDLGFDTDERRYVPHIAIAKINNTFVMDEGAQKELEEFMLNNNFQPIEITALKLFESIPEEGFHRHNTLAEVPLE